MQEDILSPEITTKVYIENAIRIATFLGGPMATGYLMAQNYENLGQGYKVKKTWIFTILATILIAVIATILPPKTPNLLLPIVYSVVAFYLVKNLQGPDINLHISSGGATYNIWRGVLIGFIGMAILVAILLAAFLIIEALNPGFLG